MKRFSILLGALAALTVSACKDAEPLLQPLIPPTPPDNPEIVSAGWSFDVLRDERVVVITPPTRGFDPAILGDFFGLDAASPDLSVIAGDVVTVNARNLFYTPIVNGRTEAQMEVQIVNKLSGVILEPPTFPVPPTGTSGLILFPFETVLIDVNGAVCANPLDCEDGSVQGNQLDGTYVVVEQPNRGLVAPSSNWTGAPHNFFNDNAVCAPTSGNNIAGQNSTDCYRWEEFETLGPFPSGVSSWRLVGFDSDASVSQFRFRAIVAADLADAVANLSPFWVGGGASVPANLGSAQVGGNIALTFPAASNYDDPEGDAITVAWDLDNNGSFETVGASASFACVLPAGDRTIRLGVFDARHPTPTPADPAQAISRLVTCTAPTPNVGISTLGAPTTVTAAQVFNVTFNVAETTGILGFTDADIVVTVTNATPGTTNFLDEDFTAGQSRGFTVPLTVTGAIGQSIVVSASITTADGVAGDNGPLTATIPIQVAPVQASVVMTNWNGSGGLVASLNATQITNGSIVPLNTVVTLQLCIGPEARAYTASFNWSTTVDPIQNEGGDFDSQFGLSGTQTSGKGACNAFGSTGIDGLSNWGTAGTGADPLLGNGFNGGTYTSAPVQGLMQLQVQLAQAGSYTPSITFTKVDTATATDVPFTVTLPTVTVQ